MVLLVSCRLCGVLNAPLQHSSVISPSAGSVKRCVTRTLEPITAIGIEAVCTADHRVSIRFTTPDGILPVYVPLRAFVEKCRAPFDSNHRPFEAQKPSIAQLEEDAETITATKGGPDAKPVIRQMKGRGNGLADSIIERLQEIYEARKRGEDKRSYTLVAQECRCSNTSVGLYFNRWARAEAGRAPITKPSGKLL